MKANKKWEYKVNLQKLHSQYVKGELSFFNYIEKIVKEIRALKNRVYDKTLKTELEDWINDMGFFDKDDNFECDLNEGDKEELVHRLDDLYDVGDANKRIWFGG